MLGHFVLLLLECIVVLHGLQDDGLGTFRFYTTDSNLLCGICSAFMLFFLLQRKNQEGRGVLSKALQGQGESWTFPPSLSLFRYISSVCLALTFFVVLLVLGPENGFAHEFLGGTRFFSHLLCPFLSIFLFLFMEEKRSLPLSGGNIAVCHPPFDFKWDWSGFRSLQLSENQRAVCRKNHLLDCSDFAWQCTACSGFTEGKEFIFR